MGSETQRLNAFAFASISLPLTSNPDSLNPVFASHVTLETPCSLAERSFGRAAIGQTRLWVPSKNEEPLNLRQFGPEWVRVRALTA